MKRMKGYLVRRYIPEKKQKGATALEGQTGGATSGVGEPAASAGRVRQEATAPAGRVRGAQHRAQLRDGRAATLPSGGHKNILKRQLIHAYFVCLFTAPAPGKSEWAPAKPIGNISD
jgi:hypothetical protein